MSRRSERIRDATASTGPATSSPTTRGALAPDFIIKLEAQNDRFVAVPPSYISASFGYDIKRYEDLCETLNDDILQQENFKRDRLFPASATFASSKKIFSTKLTKAVKQKPAYTANTFRWEHTYPQEGDAGQSENKGTQTRASSTATVTKRGGRPSKRSGQSDDSGGSSKRTKATPSGTMNPEDDDHNPDTGLA